MLVMHCSMHRCLFVSPSVLPAYDPCGCNTSRDVRLAERWLISFALFLVSCNLTGIETSHVNESLSDRAVSEYYYGKCELNERRVASIELSLFVYRRNYWGIKVNCEFDPSNSVKRTLNRAWLAKLINRFLLFLPFSSYIITVTQQIITPRWLSHLRWWIILLFLHKFSTPFFFFDRKRPRCAPCTSESLPSICSNNFFLTCTTVMEK